MINSIRATTLTELCGLPPDSLQKYLHNPSSFMSQPDDHNTLELAALREANEVLRDETLLVKSELARQDAAYLTVIRSLKNKAADPDCSAIRAAIRGLKKSLDDLTDIFKTVELMKDGGSFTAYADHVG